MSNDPNDRMHDDDMTLDPRLAELARDYNRPPAAPREAMWARIEAARRAERGAIAASVPAATPAAVANDTRVISIDAARSRRRAARPWLLVAAGLAAGLLFGVTVERFRNDTDDKGGQSIAVAPIDAPDAAAPGASATPSTLPDESTIGSSATPRIATRDTGMTRPGTTPRRAPAAVPRLTTPRVTTPAAPSYAQAAPGDRTSGDAMQSRSMYHVAAVQTLSQAEALLVAYRATAPGAAEAQQIGRWARDVLSSTRLLLDSPAARDPELQRLLGDLELLLAQLVQLSGAPLTADEREMIDRALRSRDLLPRIRSAVPSGAAASTE